MAARKAQTGSPAKSVILFSDGTGNSSAKLFKTNVWRMYEAVDLGPPSKAGQQRQIAFYDDGVGTSAFRPIALLGGIFGYGLKRNVLESYSYVCRNYDPNSIPLPGSEITEPGDHIYGFGFSRGAFTMRLVIAMIADQGIVPYTNEENLQWQVEAAYETFRRFRTRRAIQWLRDQLGLKYDPDRVIERVQQKTHWDFANKKKTHYDFTKNHRPIIRFIGVWDTVAAYGGPIVELTRAVDNWFYPLSMPDYTLHKGVRRARHSLALDDERNSFWPLLWDEIAEEKLRRARLADFPWIDEDRLRQVWFSGMHADVGGGYPDESLSYVSLMWMIEEAHKCGLRTSPEIVDRYTALVNSYGPMHDSRSGVGAYYRYQPRKIGAWLEPVSDSTLSLRDPDIRDEEVKKNPPKGLIVRPIIHESAIARVISGTDGYAPIVLPGAFDILPGTASPALPVPVRKQLKGVEPAIASAMESAWDMVWWRRVAYFVNVAVTSFLLLWPVFAPRITDETITGGSATGFRMLLGNVSELLGNLIRLLARPLPNITDRWTHAWAGSPLLFLILLGIVLWLRSFSGKLETELRDEARGIWHSAVPRIPPSTAGQPPVGIRSHVPGKLEKLRNGRGFQRGLQLLKWSFLPHFAALVTVLLAVWLVLAVGTRLTVPFLETGEKLCSKGAPTGFETARLCNDSGQYVRVGRDYVITFEVTAHWSDGRYKTDPQGLAAGRMKWLIGYFAAPFRRVFNAAYLQPIAEVRTDSTGGEVTIQPLQFEPVPGDADRFEARFTPTIDGRLYLFANDAVSLIDLDYFYTAGDAKNSGAAVVSVVEADQRK